LEEFEADEAAGDLEEGFARTGEMSIAAHDQSIHSASLSFAISNSCRRGQTPASCDLCNRRQQVIPDPRPISCGRYSERIPVCNTNRIPLNTFRSSSRLATTATRPTAPV